MPHLLRQWRERFASDPDRVCLAYDQSNAHNVVDRHSFLTRMQEVVPGLSRWLEFIYPTNPRQGVLPGRDPRRRCGGPAGLPPYDSLPRCGPANAHRIAWRPRSPAGNYFDAACDGSTRAARHDPVPMMGY